MCKLLKVSRNSIYYIKKEKESEKELERETKQIFESNRGVYGTRKIKKELLKARKGEESFKVSRRKIGKIMKKYGLISKYTKKQFKRKSKNTNEDLIPNILNREFSNRSVKEVVVSDLTYVNIQGKWHYICLITDLSNREIIGYSTGKNKAAELVKKTIYSIKGNLFEIKIFHINRDLEFKNSEINDIFNIFVIKRSLSKKSSPHDNAVAESTYNILKVEFLYKK